MNFLKNFFGKAELQKHISIETMLPPSPKDLINDGWVPIPPLREQRELTNSPRDMIMKLYFLIYPYCKETLNINDNIHKLHTAGSGLTLHGNTQRAIIRYKDTDLITFKFIHIEDNSHLNGQATFSDECTTGWVLEGPWSENAYNDFKIYFDDLEEERAREKRQLQDQYNDKIREIMSDYEPVKVESYLASERCSGDTTYC